MVILGRCECGTEDAPNRGVIGKGDVMGYPVRPRLKDFSCLCFFACYVIICAHRTLLYLVNHEIEQVTLDSLVGTVPSLDPPLGHAVSWPITGDMCWMFDYGASSQDSFQSLGESP